MMLITTLSASMVLPFGSAVYANTQALPNWNDYYRKWCRIFEGFKW